MTDQPTRPLSAAERLSDGQLLKRYERFCEALDAERTRRVAAEQERDDMKAAPEPKEPD